jgi:hypothetical protein
MTLAFSNFQRGVQPYLLPKLQPDVYDQEQRWQRLCL